MAAMALDYLDDTNIRCHETKAPKSSAMITQLPDELLLKITSEITGAKSATSLINLAMAHPQRFSSIVRETLVLGGKVPASGLVRYLELLKQHSGWAARVTFIHLYRRDVSSHQDLVQTVLGLKCGVSIESMWRGNWEAEKRQVTQVTRCLIELANMLPNLKGMDFGIGDFLPNEITAYLYDEQHRLLKDSASIPVIGTQIQRSFLDKLEVLRISRKRSENWVPILVDLSQFSNLKYLYSPWQYINTPYCATDMFPPFSGLDRNPEDILPLRLEFLRIFCARATFPRAWLSKLHASRSHFGCLRTVEIYFDCTFPTFMGHAMQTRNRNMLFSFIRVLKAFSASDISLHTGFLLNDRRGVLDDPTRYQHISLLDPLVVKFE
jgi:hypothetical protein